MGYSTGGGTISSGDTGGDSDSGDSKAGDSKSGDKRKKAVQRGGAELNRAGVEQLNRLAQSDLDKTRESPNTPSMKRGGVTRKKGRVKLHRGEQIKRRGKKHRAKGRY